MSDDEILAALQEAAEIQGFETIPDNIKEGFLSSMNIQIEYLDPLEWREGVLFRQQRWWVKTKSFRKAKDALAYRTKYAEPFNPLEDTE